MKRRTLSFILSLVLLISGIPNVIVSAENSSDITVSASSGENTVKIVKNDDDDDYDYDYNTSTGIVKLSYDSSQSIERDYAQTVLINAENISDYTQSVYLVCDNPYDDIYMNFVKKGAKDAPAAILKGESDSIELSVFAQNAQKTAYNIPITAYNSDDEYLASMVIRIQCATEIASVKFTHVSTDENTLAAEYSVTNNTDRSISDLTLSIDGDAKDYAKISPNVENYELASGESVTVKMVPDLSKIKADELTAVRGSIQASGGASGTAAFTIDVEGKDIVSSYAGNMQISWDYDEETGTLVITGGGNMPDFEEDLVPWANYIYCAKRVVIGNYVENIGDYAFYNFDSIEEVYIPANLKEIGESAFADCDNIKTISYTGSEEDWDSIAKASSWDSNSADYELSCGVYNYYQLNDVSVEDGTATVLLTNISDAVINVEIYDEESGDLAAYGSQEVEMLTDSVDVAIDNGSIPEYFIVKVKMLDGNSKLLCEELESIHYTKSFTEFLEKDISEFDEERAVNFDEQTDMNFAVVSDDVILVKTDGTDNVVSESDTEGLYTVSNITDEIKDLRENDKLLIISDNAEECLAADVESITISGNTAEIVTYDAAATEFFDYVKIEASEYDAELASLMDYSGEISYSTTLEAEWSSSDESVSINCSAGFTVKLRYYYDPSLLGDDYVEIDVSVGVGQSIEIGCKAEYKWDTSKTLGSVNIPTQIPILFVSLDATVKASLEANLAMTAELGVDASVGYIYNTNTGGRPYTTLDVTASIKTEEAISFKIGLVIGINANLVKTIKIVEFAPEAGVILSASAEQSLGTPEGEGDSIHDCILCIGGQADAYLTASISILAVGDESLYSFQFPEAKKNIGHFHISQYEYGGDVVFEWKECDNLAYKTTVTVLDKDNDYRPVSHAYVKISTVDSNPTGKYHGPADLYTDTDGTCYTYLSAGNYEVVCEDKVKKFTMGESTKSIQIVLGEEEIPEDGKENEPLGGSADYNPYEGRQCTNAGQTTSNLYIGDTNGSGTSDDISGITAMYETGRMYDGRPYGGNESYAEDQFGGDSYIHHNREVESVYYINGHEISVPVSSGLTDMYIVDLSEGIQYLQPGNNVIVRDYDTDAGHYDVVANREITLIYAADKEVSYISTPETEEETRLLPDFAVYTETICLENTAIIGEENTATVKIYNRGSLGGWADVTINDGTNELYSETNRYMPEFSMDEITFSYTPEKETSSIVVTLTNKGLLNEDKDESNNTAEHTVTARQRQIPVIESIGPEEIETDKYSSQNITLTADISNADDMESVLFTVDGQEYSAENTVITKSTSDSSVRASINAGELDYGEHTVSVSVSYYSGGGTESVTKEQNINISVPDALSFNVDDTVQNPKFYIFKSSQRKYLSVESGDNGYILEQTTDMNQDITDYKMITVCDGGMIITDMEELDGSTLSLNGGSEILFSIQPEDEVSISSVSAYMIDDSYYSMSSLNLKDNSLVVVGAETLDFNIRYRINDLYMSGNLKRTVSIDSQSISVELKDFYKIYGFNFTEEPDSYEAKINVGHDYYYNSYTPDNILWDSGTMWIVLTENDKDFDAVINGTQPVILTLNCYDTLYIEDISEYSEPVTLDKSEYNRVYFTGTSEQLDISSIYCCWKSDIHIYEELYADEIYLPDGEYSLNISYNADSLDCSYYADSLILSGWDREISLPSKSIDAAVVNITWPSLFPSASLSYGAYSDDEYISGYIDSVVRGGNVSLPKGENELYISCTLLDDDGYYDRAWLEMSKNVNIGDDGDASLSFGNNFTGELTTYNDSDGDIYSPGDTMTAYLANLTDDDGAYLSYYRAYDHSLYLSGYMTFVDISDSAKTYNVPVSIAGTSDSIDVNLPSNMADGEYSYSLSLVNDGKIEMLDMEMFASVDEYGSIDVNIENNESYDADGVLIFAQYDGENNLLSVEVSDYTAKCGITRVSFSPDYDCESARVFFWKKLGLAAPYCNSVNVLIE